MDANGDLTTTIDHLFAGETAAPAQAHEPQPSPPEPYYEPVTPSQPAAQPQPAPPVAQPEPQREQPRMVPLPELIETRKRAQEAERREQMLLEALSRLNQGQPQQPQPQPQVIDPLADPEGAYHALQQRLAQQEQATQERLLAIHLNTSERYARQAYGNDTVDRALEAVQAAGMNQMFLNRPDPYADLVSWYRGQVAAQEIGDPTTYRQKIEAETRARILAEMRQGGPAPSNLPPSLATATRATTGTSDVGSDKDFFNQMMNRKR